MRYAMTDRFVAAEKLKPGDLVYIKNTKAYKCLLPDAASADGHETETTLMDTDINGNKKKAENANATG